MGYALVSLRHLRDFFHITCKEMDVLKSVLAARQDKSPEVQELLDCLEHSCCDLQICICSIGGVGSTFLTSFLTQLGCQCNLLTDHDAVRHINRPPPHPPAGKVVYMLGDPLAAVASHYRRDHALHQAQKTCSHPAMLQAATFPATFEQYVERGEDLFGIEQHIDNWLHVATPYDVLFVRYENMFDLPVAEAIFDYLLTPIQQPTTSSGNNSSQHKPKQLAAAFAALKQPRASSVPDRYKLKMYVQLAATIRALPPVFVRDKDCHVHVLST